MYHYNAFISYNHNPRDIRITRLLQQKLENYRLPEGITSPEGTSRIERIFLDKGELEVAGDLNKVIMDALENSDYLIVICSPESRESIWVRREIEFFLKNHSLDQILTVITEGEPFDVLPDILLYEEVYDEETGQTVRNFREPLSCDYRLPEKDANRTELPRLVAALVGCRYDDLVQRRKQRAQKIKMRIAAGAAAVMMLASVYMIWNNHRLSVSYDKTLTEQSRSLVLQSEQALSRGDRIDAVRYALEALPSEKQPRPLVTDAVLALSSALSMYQTPQTINSESAARLFKGSVNGRPISDSTVRSLGILSGDDNHFLTADYENNSVCIWDCKTGEQILTDYTDGLYSEGFGVRKAVAGSDGNLYLLSGSGIRCLDVSAGQELWNVDLGDYHYYGNDVSIAGGALWVSLTRDSSDEYDFMSQYYFVRAIDTSSGKTISEYHSGRNMEQIEALPDGRSAVCAFRVEKEDSDEESVSSEDLLKSDHYELTAFGPGEDDVRDLAEYPYINNIQMDSNGRLIVVSQSEDPGIDTSEPSMFTLVDGPAVYISSTYARKTYILTCIDPSGWNTLWTEDLTGFLNSVPQISAAGTPESQEGLTACTIGRTLIYYDDEGNVADSYDFGSIVMGYYRKDDDESLYAVLTDGSRGRCSMKEKYVNNRYNVFLGPVSDALYNDGSLFIVSSDTASNVESIIEYHMTGQDEHWQECPPPPVPAGWEVIDKLQAEAVGDGFAEIREYNNTDVYKDGRYQKYGILLRDTGADDAASEEIWLDGPLSSRYEYAGCVDEKLYFIEAIGQPIHIACVDPVTGEIRQDELEPELDTVFKERVGVCVTHDHDGAKWHLLYCPDFYFVEEGNESSRDLELITADPSGGEQDIVTLRSLTEEEGSYITDYDSPKPYFDKEKQKLWIAVSEDTVIKYDMRTGQEELSIELDYPPSALAADANGALYIIESGGALDADVDSTLHVYDGNAGKALAEIPVGNFEVYDQKADTNILSDGNILLITKYDALVLDAKDRSLLSRIYSFRSYNDYTEEILLEEDYDRTQILSGHVPYRTLDEIILEGAEFIGRN